MVNAPADDLPFATAEFGQEIYQILDYIIRHRLGAKATISVACCHQVAQHFFRDMEKLVDIHQRHSEENDGRSGEVDPIKCASYAAFWVRKIKPVSKCFHFCDLDTSGSPKVGHEYNEIVDANERCTIYIAMTFIGKASKIGWLEPVYPELTRDVVVRRLTEYFKELHSSSSIEGSTKTAFERLVYDMRFRTYGPHQLTQLLSQVLFSRRS